MVKTKNVTARGGIIVTVFIISCLEYGDNTTLNYETEANNVNEQILVSKTLEGISISDRQQLLNYITRIKILFDSATVIPSKDLLLVDKHQYLSRYSEPLYLWAADSSLTWSYLILSRDTDTTDIIKLSLFPEGHIFISRLGIEDSVEIDYYRSNSTSLSECSARSDVFRYLVYAKYLFG